MGRGKTWRDPLGCTSRPGSLELQAWHGLCGEDSAARSPEVSGVRGGGAPAITAGFLPASFQGQVWRQEPRSTETEATVRAQQHVDTGAEATRFTPIRGRGRGGVCCGLG